MAVCDHCIEALDEEGALDMFTVLTPEEATSTAIDLGADIPDHDCDEMESVGGLWKNGDIQCDCSCHPRKRGAKKRMTGIDHKGVTEVYRQVYE